MALTITHPKVNQIPDWTQPELDAQIALGNFPPGTVLADITLAQDWNSAHTVSGTLDASAVNGLTANRALVSSGTGSVTVSATTDTEIGYVSGVTSAIQTQLNGKQASGNYVTALTGDVTATGPGSVAATLATVNADVGSFTNANITVNAKGLITAASNGSGGSGSPGGSDTQIQFNDAGSFGGDADFTWNKTTNNLALTGTQVITATSATAFVVGQNGATNPALTIDTNIATSATGVAIQSRASATSTVGLTATSSAAACDLIVSSKGAGILDLTGGSGGSVRINPSGLNRFTLSSTVCTFSNSLINYVFAAGANTTASTVRFQFTGASDTALTAGANAISVRFNLAQTRTHASNTAITTQQDFVVSGSTHAFVTSGGVITDLYAGTFNAGAAGANATVTNNWALYSNGNLAVDGDFKLRVAGNGLYVKEGTNAAMGVATLVGGTVTVNTTKVTANSRVFLTVQSLGTVILPQAVGVTARVAGTSFTITSAGATDTSVVAWHIIEPA